MKKNMSLDQIANSFMAASQIKDLFSSSVHRDSDSFVKPSNTELLTRTLEILASYSPDKYRKQLSETTRKCCDYTQTYNNLRQHFASYRGRPANIDGMIKTFSAVKPMLGNREKVLVDKILKIYDIIIS